MSRSIAAHNLAVAEAAVVDLRNRVARLERDCVEVLRQYDAAEVAGDARTMRELSTLRTEIEADLADMPDRITKAEQRRAAAVFAYTGTHEKESA